MNFDDYQKQAMGFRLPSATEAYALFGLSGEVGELLGSVAKDIRDNRVPNLEHLKKELGDVLWFVAAIASDLELSLGDVAQANIDKLSKRKTAGTIQGSGDDR